MRYGVSTLISARFDGLLRSLSQFAARLERIGRAAAPHRLEVVAAHRPVNPRPRRLLGEREQIENHVEGRMTAADDQDALAGVALPLRAEDIGNAVGDAIAMLALPDRVDAARA